MIKERNLDSTLKNKIKTAGLGAAAEVHYATLSTGATYSYYRDKVAGDRIHTTIATAHTGATTGRNDTVLLSPDSHSQATGLTWSKNLTHLIGMYPEAMQNQRSRIGHSANFATLLTVTGYGNLFSNLYFMHGRGNATNLNCLTDTGGRNTYKNCHFLPANATELDQAAYDLVRLGSNELYFKDCFFGSDAVTWTNGNMIEFMASTDPPRAVFENCIFLMNADNAQVTFLKAIAGLGRCLIMFKNCQFINVGTTLTLAIDGTGLGDAKMVFDNNCFFYGVTDICTNGKDTNVICGIDYGKAGGDDVNNLIAGFADHTT